MPNDHPEIHSLTSSPLNDALEAIIPSSLPFLVTPAFECGADNPLVAGDEEAWSSGGVVEIDTSTSRTSVDMPARPLLVSPPLGTPHILSPVLPKCAVSPLSLADPDPRAKTLEPRMEQSLLRYDHGDFHPTGNAFT
jgi:hypothetical protein